MPWYLLFDYVEVFTYDEHLNEFDFLWRDDFDDFNEDRWHKADGGFEENSSVFSPDNVYTSHGYLVMKMEPEDAEEKRELMHHDTHRHAGEAHDAENPDHDIHY